jgi:ATP-dependent RNA helicase DeaD
MTESFSPLGFGQEVVDALARQGIKEPTPIQTRAIPVLMEGRDLIAQAQTGTGKTLAFLLPILERIDVHRPAVQALILTPTRELAIQITAEAKKLAPVKGASVLAIYGGQDVESQLKKLKGSIHLVVATPGRLLDHLRRGTVDLTNVSMFVLDEADQMLHMGFLPDVEQLLRQAAPERNTMLFSATMPQEIRTLARRYMRAPVEMQVQGQQITLENIEQVVVETTDRAKQDALCQKLDEYNPYLALIFCRTKIRADILFDALTTRGYNADVLHGDLSQAKRQQVMKRFREADIQFLVATDVAARGIDVEGVSHVFNYDIPHDVESYIHRIGRTGRAGHKGVAVTFATPKDREFLQMIEQGTAAAIQRIGAGAGAGTGTKVVRQVPREHREREARPAGVSRREHARAVAKPGTRADARPGTRTDARPGTRADARPGARADARPGARTDARPGTRTDSRPGTRADARPNPRGPKREGKAGPRSPRTR